MTIPVTAFPIVSRETPVVVFTNSMADCGRAADQIPRAQQVFQQAGIPVEFETSAGLAEFGARVSARIERHHRLLLVLGGDGTFHHLVNATVGSAAVVGMLAAGGGNDCAAALALQKDFSDIPRLIEQQKVRSIDVLRIRTADGKERFCVGSAGVGLDAEAARLASTTYRRVAGRLRYILSALHAFLRFVPPQMQIEFPAEPARSIRDTLLFGSALNASTCGGGLRIAPSAELADGLLDLVLLKQLGVVEVLRMLPGLVRRGEVHSAKLSVIQTRSVKITTERPCIFQGDGEILGLTPVEIAVVPRAIRVLAP